jgi:hypothetical protein
MYSLHTVPGSLFKLWHIKHNLTIHKRNVALTVFNYSMPWLFSDKHHIQRPPLRITSHIYINDNHVYTRILTLIVIVNYKSKIIPVTGCRGLYGCKMLSIPQYLDNRLTDGGKVVSLSRLPRSTPQKHYFSASGIHFCYRLRKPRGLLRSQG